MSTDPRMGDAPREVSGVNSERSMLALLLTPTISTGTAASDPNAFSCHFCDCAYSYRSGLQRHLRTHHPNGDKVTLPCTTCGKGFASKESLKRHEETHNIERSVFWCTRCNRTFTTKFSLGRHEDKHHPQEVTNDGTTDWCSHPNVTFSCTKDSLKRHQQTSNKVAMFQCTRCTKRFTDRDSLTKHQQVHEATQVRCTHSQCDKTFRRKSAMTRHLSAHKSVPL
eukprot:Polyplicarium_translucidae@DN1879_c0_g1_i2.p1